MSDYRTGNTRTLTLVVPVAGLYKYTLESLTVDPDVAGPSWDYTDVSYATYSLSFAGGNVTIEPYLVEHYPGSTVTGDPTAVPIGAPPTSIDVGATVTLYAGGYAAPATVNLFGNHPYSGTGTLAMSFDVAGNITFAVSLQELIEETSGGGAGGWYDSVPDAPGVTYVRLSERITSITVTSTAGGGTLSQTYTPNATAVLAYGVAGQISGTALKGGGGTWSLTPTGITDPTWPGGTISTANGIGSISGWASLMLLSGATTIIRGVAVATVSYDKPVAISINTQAMDVPYPAALGATIAGIPGTTSAASFSGNFSASGTQQQIAGSGTIDSTAVTAPTVSNYGPVSASLTGASLTTAGEDYVNPAEKPNPAPERFSDTEWFRPRITRLLARGKTFSGIGLALASTYPTPAGSWPAAAASITRTFDPEWPTGSYPFMRFVVTGHGGSVMRGTITIPPCSVAVVTDPTVGPVETEVYTGSETPTKSWSFVTHVTDGVAQTVEIPLYAPDSISDSPDTQDSDWPFPVRRPLYTGVYRIPSITIALDTPTGGQTLEVTSVELFRSDHAAKVTYLPTWFHSIYSPETIFRAAEMYPEWPLRSGPDTRVSGDEDGGTTSKHYIRRGLVAFQDGMQCLEESDLGYTRTEAFPSGIVSFAFDQPTIQTLCDRINGTIRQLKTDGTVAGMIKAHPGWTATPSVPVPAFTPGAFPAEIPPISGYLNAGLPAVYLAGAGMMRLPHVSGGVTTYSLDPVFDLAGGADAQALYDSVEWYPGWGGFEHVTGGSTGEGAIAFFGAVLRGQAEGQILRQRDSTASLSTLLGHQRPYDTIGLTLKQIDPAPGSSNVWAAVGTGTSDIDGWYHTAAPSGRAGDLAHRIGCTGHESTVQLNSTIPAPNWWARHRRRAAFLFGPATGPGPLTIDSPRQWLHAATANVINTWHLAHVNGLPIFSGTYSSVDSFLSLTHDPRAAGSLYMLGLSGSTLKTFVSTDGGQTGVEVHSVTAASGAIERDSERAWLVHIYEDGAGVLQRTLSRDGGTTWETAAPPQLGGANMTFSVQSLKQDARHAGSMYMAVKDAGGNGKVMLSTDAGLTWVQVLG